MSEVKQEAMKVVLDSAWRKEQTIINSSMMLSQLVSMVATTSTMLVRPLRGSKSIINSWSGQEMVEVLNYKIMKYKKSVMWGTRTQAKMKQ